MLHAILIWHLLIKSESLFLIKVKIIESTGNLEVEMQENAVHVLQFLWT